MPRGKTRTTINNKNKEEEQVFLIPFNSVEPPKPNITSFVSRNAALIQARTTNSQLESEGEGQSKDLVKGKNKDLIAILGPEYSDQFKSPYDTVDLIRFHEALRDDGIVAACLDFLVQFILGDHFKTVIDVNTEFDSEEEEKQALESFKNNPKIRGYKKELDRVNRETKFQTRMMALLVQAFGFGRGCGLIETSDIDNLPIAIKVLPSMHLGQVYVNRKTWDVLGVEHLDWKFPASIIKSENMIYFPSRDYNISPGTAHYGYSLLERIVDLSELNRITNQRNLKEINYRLWAAFLLVKLPGSYNRDMMKKLITDISKGAGNSIIVNNLAQIEIHQLGHDMDKLLDERDKNYREEIRQLQVPIILFDPDILNRATSQELMEAWTVSVLKIYRSWFKDIVQDQWINPIIKTLIENERNAARNQDNVLEESQIEEDKSTTTTTTAELETSANNNKNILPIEAIDPKTNEVLVYRLPWKIKIELEPINYDTFKEKAETSILLKNNGLSTTKTALKRIGVTDEQEVSELLELEQKRQEERFAFGAERFKQLGERDPNEMNRQRTIENQRQSLRQELSRTKNQNQVKNIGIKKTAEE